MMNIHRTILYSYFSPRLALSSTSDGKVECVAQNQRRQNICKNNSIDIFMASQQSAVCCLFLLLCCEENLVCALQARQPLGQFHRNGKSTPTVDGKWTGHALPIVTYIYSLRSHMIRSVAQTKLSMLSPAPGEDWSFIWQQNKHDQISRFHHEFLPFFITCASQAFPRNFYLLPKQNAQFHLLFAPHVLHQ